MSPTRKYDYFGNFSEGLTWVRNGYKFGFIDKTGREVVPCIYNDADYFFDGLARVSTYHNHGYLDKTGEMVLSFD